MEGAIGGSSRPTKALEPDGFILKPESGSIYLNLEHDSDFGRFHDSIQNHRALEPCISTVDTPLPPSANGKDFYGSDGANPLGGAIESPNTLAPA